jgi:hypothetical protein
MVIEALDASHSHGVLTNYDTDLTPAKDSLCLLVTSSWKTMARFNEKSIEQMLPRDDHWMKDEAKAQKTRYGDYFLRLGSLFLLLEKNKMIGNQVSQP